MLGFGSGCISALLEFYIWFISDMLGFDIWVYICYAQIWIRMHICSAMQLWIQLAATSPSISLINASMNSTNDNNMDFHSALGTFLLLQILGDT